MKKDLIIKYGLFIFVLVLVILIVHKKNNRLTLAVRYRETPPVTEVMISDVVIHVANGDDLIVPLHVTVKHDEQYTLNGYEDLILGDGDQLVYYTFSLLTNLSNHLPEGVKTYIPRSTKLLSYEKNGPYLTLNVSQDFYNYSKNHELIILSIISHTFKKTLDVEYIKILVEGKRIDYTDYDYVWIYHNDFILNPVNDPANNQTPLVIYYYVPIGEEYYLTPVTYFIRDGENRRTLIDMYLSESTTYPVLSFPDNHDLMNKQYLVTLMANQLMAEDETLNQFNKYGINLY